MIDTPLFTIFRDGEIKTLPPTEWLVEELVPARKFVELYGEDESLKTFVVLDMAYAIAHGTDWQGRAVKPGPVLYLCMEGGDDLQNRRDAWKAARGIPLDEDADIYFITVPVSFLDDEFEQVVNGLRQAGSQFSLIVIDTLTRAFGDANANATDDMTRFANRCDRLRLEFDGTVLVIHHTGWDANRPANSRVLRNNADAVIKVERKNKRGNDVVLKCEKMKSASHFKDTRLVFEVVDLPPGADGKPRNSLALSAVDKAPSDPLDEDSLVMLRLLVGRRAAYGDWMTAAENAGVTGSTFKRRLVRLRDEEYVTSPPDGDSKGFEYELTPAGVELASPEQVQTGSEPVLRPEEVEEANGLRRDHERAQPKVPAAQGLTDGLKTGSNRSKAVGQSGSERVHHAGPYVDGPVDPSTDDPLLNPNRIVRPVALVDNLRLSSRRTA